MVGLSIQIVNVRITHKTARVPLLESVCFKDLDAALKAIRGFSGVDECVILQTCNRVEVFVVCQDGLTTAKAIKSFMVEASSVNVADALEAVELCLNQDTLIHVLRISAGLESMIIGEDQIVNQVWAAYLAAENAKTNGPILKHIFSRAVDVGRRIRNETGISKGAVSIGSAAVELAESLGNFYEKKTLVIGAGETGTLVAKALSRRCKNPILIANRTYDHAVRLAQEISAQVVRFDKLEEVLIEADVVICATAAPHYMLTKNLLLKIMPQRTKKDDDLVIIDVSNPRNVEKSISDIEHVQLYNIDDLNLIAEQNKSARQKSVKQASEIIDVELSVLNKELKTCSVTKIISELFAHAEGIRQRELKTALSMLGEASVREKKIINDLTFILLKEMLVPIVQNLRQAAITDDTQLIENTEKLFGFNKTNEKKEFLNMQNCGLIVIGHGSRLPYGQQNLEKLVNILKKRSDFNYVELAFMCQNRPTISEAIDAMVQKDVSRIVLVPAFMAPGVHTTQDIPELIEIKNKDALITSKGIKIIYGEPLCADDRVAQIIEENAFKALGKRIPAVENLPSVDNNPVASKKMYLDSMKLIRPEIQDILAIAPKNQASVIERVVHTTADPEFAKLLFFSDGAVEAGINAIKAGAKIVTDVKMVKAGINESRVKQFGGKILTYIDDPRTVSLANESSTTKAIAAMRLATKDGLNGAIVLIGNAPTAAFELARTIDQGLSKPALIVATPVGYVDAAESKETISKLNTPHIIIKGRKGGSAIAVGIFNALLAMAEEQTAPKIRTC